MGTNVKTYSVPALLAVGAVTVERVVTSLLRTAGKEAFTCFRASDRSASAKLVEFAGTDCETRELLLEEDVPGSTSVPTVEDVPFPSALQITGAAAMAAATRGASVCDGLKVTIGDGLLVIWVW